MASLDKNKLFPGSAVSILFKGVLRTLSPALAAEDPKLVWSSAHVQKPCTYTHMHAHTTGGRASCSTRPLYLQVDMPPRGLGARNGHFLNACVSREWLPKLSNLHLCIKIRYEAFHRLSKALLLEPCKFGEPCLANRSVNPAFCCQTFITDHLLYLFMWIFVLESILPRTKIIAKEMEWKDPAVGEISSSSHFPQRNSAQGAPKVGQILAHVKT